MQMGNVRGARYDFACSHVPKGEKWEAKLVLAKGRLWLWGYARVTTLSFD